MIVSSNNQTGINSLLSFRNMK